MYESMTNFYCTYYLFKNLFLSLKFPLKFETNIALSKHFVHKEEEPRRKTKKISQISSYYRSPEWVIFFWRVYLKSKTGKLLNLICYKLT